MITATPEAETWAVYTAVGYIALVVTCTEKQVKLQLTNDAPYYVRLPKEVPAQEASRRYRVVNGAILPRPKHNFGDRTVAVRETLRLTGYTDGYLVAVNGEEHRHDGNEPIELEFDAPGTYPVTIMSWPWQAENFNVTVTLLPKAKVKK